MIFYKTIQSDFFKIMKNLFFFQILFFLKKLKQTH